MRILVVHNRYRSGRGGEDTVVDNEVLRLVQHGHVVNTMLASNSGLGNESRLVGVSRALWSRKWGRDVEQAIGAFQPDIVHFHNTFATLSASVFWAAHRLGIPTVATLHNFRWLCGTATLLRDACPCVECITSGTPIPGLMHRCTYAGSTSVAALILGIGLVHTKLMPFHRAVDIVIAPSAFVADTYVRAGFPSEKLRIVPNAVMSHQVEDIVPCTRRKRQFVFAGYLDANKGFDLFLEACQILAECRRDWSAIVFGDGPLQDRLPRGGNPLPVLWRGRQPHSIVLAEISQSLGVVVPSRCYETFGMVAVEAFSTGTPVIAACHGALGCLPGKNEAWMAFAPGIKSELAGQMSALLDLTEESWTRMSESATGQYLRDFAPEITLQPMLAAYSDAIGIRRRRVVTA